jgi:hypothetical protein
MSADSKNDSNDRNDRNDAAGANRQRAESGRHTDFPAATPESNVNPPGAPQTSHGSATGPIPGGTQGAARAGEGMQSGMGATAGAVVTPDDAAATADRGTSRRDS